MNTPDNGHNKPKRFRGSRPETEAKYSQAIELYRSTRLSCAEICRACGVTESGLRGYIDRHHRDLLLARNCIVCSKEEAHNIKLNQLRGQLPATRIKYREAIQACGSNEFISLNLSQIARQYGLTFPPVAHALSRSDRVAGEGTRAVRHQ